MICVAISNKNKDEILYTLNRVEMAEIRLDLCKLSDGDLTEIFGHSTPTIATCRPENSGKELQLDILSKAIAAGADYVDIEIEADEQQRNALIQIAREHHCRVIISYHNYTETPGLRELYQIADECFALGADVAKLAVAASDKSDAARILSLYSMDKPLVVLGMGDAGKITRIAAPLLGAEFTFAAMDDGTSTAPGQITVSAMNDMLSILEKHL